MLYPSLTAAYAGALGIVFVVISGWVIAKRVGAGVNHGDGGDQSLNRRIRAHANFAEYAPLILLLASLLEAGGAARFTIHALLLPLLIARVLHPFGMIAAENTPQQFACRGASAIVTLIVLAAAAVLLLLRAI